MSVEGDWIGLSLYLEGMQGSGVSSKVVKFEAKKKLAGKSERVKCVDIHPSECWILASLYNGTVILWNYESQTVVKTFEITSLPIRTGKFIAQKSWFITGSDDLQLRVFNYNTFERVAAWDAHVDYIRCVAVHPSKSFVLSCSDDLTIKLWDWQNNWSCVKVFEGHMHYVMQVAFNPKDTNTFASCSLDHSIKVWNLGSQVPNYTLEGHEKGVCTIAYYPGSDKPYLASGGDDKQIRLWDYQSKACVQVLMGHTGNVNVVLFHPSLPLLLSGAEDETLRVWNLNSFRLENVYQYGFERIWSIAAWKDANMVALGCDRGTIGLQLGKDEPVISMDGSGKLIWAKNSEILTTSIKDSDIADGERLVLPSKDLGQCELYPTQLKHSPSGRFVVTLGDGEYIIYTALAWRNKSFGTALDFVWSGGDSSYYAVQESSYKVSIYQNFNLHHTLKESGSVSALYGGALLGILAERGGSCPLLYFYSWSEGDQYLIRRMDVDPKALYWSESGKFLMIATQREGFFLLKYNADAVNAYKEQGIIPDGDDGIEEAFQVIAEQPEEDILSGIWIGDACFVYTTTGSHKLAYYMAHDGSNEIDIDSSNTPQPMEQFGQNIIASNLQRPLYLLGYLSRHERIYLADQECHVYSYHLNAAVIEYQVLVLAGDLQGASNLLPNIPSTEYSTLAKFLQARGYLEEALNLTTDEEQKFALALRLERLDIALSIAKSGSSLSKWRTLATFALQNSLDISLLQTCLENCQSVSDILLFHHATGDAQSLEKLSSDTQLKDVNVAFISLFLLGRLSECFDLLMKNLRYEEAAFFAKTWIPESTPEALSQCSKKIKKMASLKQLHVDFGSLLSDQILPSRASIILNSQDSIPSHITSPNFPSETRAVSALKSPTRQKSASDALDFMTDIPQHFVPSQHSGPVDSFFGTEHNSTLSDNQSYLSMEVNTTGTGSIREDLTSYLSGANSIGELGPSGTPQLRSPVSGSAIAAKDVSSSGAMASTTSSADRSISSASWSGSVEGSSPLFYETQHRPLASEYQKSTGDSSLFPTVIPEEPYLTDDQYVLDSLSNTKSTAVDQNTKSFLFDAHNLLDDDLLGYENEEDDIMNTEKDD
jgi:coatomer subunit beta'